MSERDRQLDREFDVDTELESDPEAESRSSLGIGYGQDSMLESEQQQGTAERGGFFRSRIEFSTTGFIVAILCTIVGVLGAGMIPLIGFLGTFLGIFAGGFLYGTVASSNRYLEAAAGGATVGSVAMLWSYLLWALLTAGLAPIAMGLVGGALAGAGGHYFGRDLRDGLTRDLGDPPDGLGQ